MEYTNEKVKLMFEGGLEFTRTWLAADDQRAQRVLRNHKEERVNCLCTPFGVPMHIVCREGRYFLASNPGRASHHALSCPSYHPAEEASGLRHYSGEAICRASHHYKLAVRPEAPTGPPFDHFTPSAALQFLWELAGLNVCTPKTVARRSFLPLSRSLWRVTHKVLFNKRAIRAYVPLASREIDGCQHVIGQVSRIHRGKFAIGVNLAADREHTFWVDQKQWQNSPISKLLGTYEDPKLADTTWLMARLWLSPKGNFNLYHIGVLPVNDQLLPSYNGLKEPIDKLVENRRRFFVCQRYDAIDDDSVPLAVLIDRKEPQSLYYPLLS